LPGATMNINDFEEIKGQSADIAVEPDKLRALRVFISVPPQSFKMGQTSFNIVVKDKQSFETDTYKAVFEVPENMK
jgi:IG-like fold at C-terminal of FixG, putative oxidoreductase